LKKDNDELKEAKEKPLNFLQRKPEPAPSLRNPQKP
jgi:hypothetical protein